MNLSLVKFTLRDHSLRVYGRQCFIWGLCPASNQNIPLHTWIVDFLLFSSRQRHRFPLSWNISLQVYGLFGCSGMRLSLEMQSHDLFSCWKQWPCFSQTNFRATSQLSQLLSATSRQILGSMCTSVTVFLGTSSLTNPIYLVYVTGPGNLLNVFITSWQPFAGSSSWPRMAPLLLNDAYLLEHLPLGVGTSSCLKRFHW